jgi:FkbM family methyltransferase
VKTSAQNKEDLVLIQYFQKRDGVFVDVGAHDGIQFSNTHLLEKDFGWTGVCVEPHPDSFRKLKRNRPMSMCHNLASVNKEHGTVNLFVPNGTEVLGSTKPDRDGIGRILGIQAANVRCKTFRVKGERLAATLERSGFESGDRYDLLSVDTEWTELEVLKSARLDKYYPDVIVVEANDNAKADEIKHYLDQCGYYFCGFVGGINYFFVNDQSTIDKMGKAISYVASGNCPNL